MLDVPVGVSYLLGHDNTRPTALIHGSLPLNTIGMLQTQAEAAGVHVRMIRASQMCDVDQAVAQLTIAMSKGIIPCAYVITLADLFCNIIL